MSVGPTVVRRLMRELSELRTNPPEGIRVQTSDEDMLDVTGIIEGPGTPYAGGYFRVKFKFTEEFPAAPPKCWFATKIFHPNVSNTGEICVNTLKKDWKSTYGISHILVTVKCLLIYPNPESALDEEAGKLLLENYSSYCDRAKLITSVHATPRHRPVEFDSPAASTEPPATSATETTSKPNTPITTAASPPPATPVVPCKIPPPQPQPLKSAPSNVSVEKDIPSGKEQHTSPSPLSTADANVGGKIGTAVGIGANNAPPPLATKAIKRAATGGAALGAEKRKKALKRL
ncbi:ubiquitin-conjugating enzyme/RWD-like protein [Infundibulicybe gibba]|nr:ubiquitin-conjugating enzyme/RWD-like protein [Infundibulicybe gibba]